MNSTNTDSSDMVPRRRNGWNWPPNPMQICSWIAVNFLSIIVFITSYPLPVYPGFQILFFCVIVWVIVCMIYATSTDPGTGTNIIPAKFDRQKNSHVIEKGFCNICLINVSSGTKHCRRCNKCIPGFDHHCKYLNNCIGSKNYKAFIFLIASLVLASLMCFIFFVYTLVSFISSTSRENVIPVSFDRNRLLINIWGWFILNIIIIIIFGVAFVSTLHLLSFHIMLLFNNQTTFSYIVDQRRKNERAAGVDTTDQTLNSSKSLHTPNQAPLHFNKNSAAVAPLPPIGDPVGPNIV